MKKICNINMKYIMKIKLHITEIQNIIKLFIFATFQQLYSQR